MTPRQTNAEEDLVRWQLLYRSWMWLGYINTTNYGTVSSLQQLMIPNSPSLFFLLVLVGLDWIGYWIGGQTTDNLPYCTVGYVQSVSRFEKIDPRIRIKNRRGYESVSQSVSQVSQSKVSNERIIMNQ